jgi:hypothetical protein
VRGYAAAPGLAIVASRRSRRRGGSRRNWGWHTAQVRFARVLCCVLVSLTASSNMPYAVKPPAGSMLRTWAWRTAERSLRATYLRASSAGDLEIAKGAALASHVSWTGAGARGTKSPRGVHSESRGVPKTDVRNVSTSWASCTTGALGVPFVAMLAAVCDWEGDDDGVVAG